jgi:hypothetical protein
MSTEEKVRAISTESFPEALSLTPGGLVLEDEILIMKDEIAREAEKIAGQEIGKQQTSTTACEMLKQELANEAFQNHRKVQSNSNSMP